MIRSQIPAALLQDDILLTPPSLVEALRGELQQRELYDQACVEGKPDSELAGGKDTEEPIWHFTHRFKSSAVRVGFVALNPNGTFEPLSTELASCLLDGSVAILDIPCGSGGGLFGLLSTFAELRSEGAVPRLPLEIRLLAADISADGRALHQAMLLRLQPFLDAHGIRVDCEYMEWDVSKLTSTTALVDRWLALAPASEEYLVFISAFSAFAVENQETTKEAIRNIAARLHNKPFVLAWVEPILGKKEKSKNKYRQFISGVIESLKGLFQPKANPGCGPLEEEFKYRHPFTVQILPGRARVVRFENLQK